MTAGTNVPRMSKPVVRCSTESSRGSRFAFRDSFKEELPDWAEGREPLTASRESRRSDIYLPMLAEDAPQRVGDFAERRARLDRGNDGRDEISAVAGGGRDLAKT